MCLTRNPIFVGFPSIISLRSFERSLSCRFMKKGTKILETTVICIRKPPTDVALQQLQFTSSSSSFIHSEGSSINLTRIPAKDIGWKIEWKEKKKPEEFDKIL